MRVFVLYIFLFLSSCQGLKDFNKDDDFNPGNESLIITGANLTNVLMNCVASSEETDTSILTCTLGFDQNSSFTAAEGFEQDSDNNRLVFADWSIQKLFGSNLNSVSCEELNSGISYRCSYQEGNKATRYFASVTLTRPSSSQSRTIDEQVNFFNLCATSTATNYNEYGQGTDTDPYILCTSNQLKDLANKSSDPAHTTALSSAFRLGKNIDNIGNLKTISLSVSTIGNPNFEGFEGTFQGNGYTISDIIFEQNTDGAYGNTASVGLFHALRNAIVEYLTIDNATLDANFENGHTFRKGFLTGAISGNTNVDHVVIKNSTMIGNNTGFLAETISLLSPQDNGATLTITNNSVESNNLEVWTHTAQHLTNHRNGGLFYDIPFTIATGNINIENNRIINTSINGLNRTDLKFGLFIYSTNGAADISFNNNYVNGCSYSNIPAGAQMGGFIHTFADNAYNFNYVSCLYPAASVGGGFSYTPFDVSSYQSSYNYWDSEINGVAGRSFFEGGSNLNNVEGKTTLEMQTQNTFVNWDFDNIWSILPNQYPTLRVFE